MAAGYDYKKSKPKQRFQARESFGSKFTRFFMGLVDGAADHAAGTYAGGASGADSVDAVVAQSMLGGNSTSQKQSYWHTVGYRAYGVLLRCLNSKAFLQYCRQRTGTADAASIGVLVFGGGAAAQAAVAGADLLAPDSDVEDMAEEDDTF